MAFVLSIVALVTLMFATEAKEIARISTVMCIPVLLVSIFAFAWFAVID